MPSRHRGGYSFHDAARHVSRLAEAGLKREVAVIDAPISGGREGALAGTLVVAAGGVDWAVERCRPVFASFGELVVHLGPVGSGQFAKLINNALLAANLTLADDALTLGEVLGVRPDVLALVLRQGSGRSYGLDVAALARGSGETRRQALPLLEKDVKNLTTDVAGLGSAATRCHCSPPRPMRPSGAWRTLPRGGRSERTEHALRDVVGGDR